MSNLRLLYWFVISSVQRITFLELQANDLRCRPSRILFLMSVRHCSRTLCICHCFQWGSWNQFCTYLFLQDQIHDRICSTCLYLNYLYFFRPKLLRQSSPHLHSDTSSFSCQVYAYLKLAVRFQYCHQCVHLSWDRLTCEVDTLNRQRNRQQWDRMLTKPQLGLLKL